MFDDIFNFSDDICNLYYDTYNLTLLSSVFYCRYILFYSNIEVILYKGYFYAVTICC